MIIKGSHKQQSEREADETRQSNIKPSIKSIKIGRTIETTIGRFATCYDAPIVGNDLV